MSVVQVDDAERMALSWFIENNWAAFNKSAQDFLTVDEIEKLAEKLSSG